MSRENKKEVCKFTLAKHLRSMQLTTLQSQTFTPANQEFLGHPKGLVVLFFTELWERFSYYGMRALLVLYMTAAVAQGGLGFDTALASTIYGVYTMSVYLFSIGGGFVADRLVGARRAILFGGIIIALGHFALAVPALTTFYLGLVLIVFGTSLLKPNISSLLGMLYKPGDDRRDAGFSIFYMGINIGAAISPFVCGYLAQHPSFKAFIAQFGFKPESSWHFGFAAAGVGMLIGLAHFIWQGKLLGHAGELRKPATEPVPAGGSPLSNESVAAGESPLSEASKPALTSEEWKRLAAIGILFVFNLWFWAVYEQAGSSLNLFADRLTRDELFGFPFPSSWFQSVPAIFVIVLAPVFSALWIKMGHKQPSSPVKFAFGLIFLGLGIGLAVPATMLAAKGLVSPLWLVGVYFLQVVGEMCLSPVGLSTVTKLAPQRFVSMTMGLWFVSMALGNFLAGKMASSFDEKNIQALVNLFGGMTVVSLGAAVLLLLLTPWVKKLMSGVR
jgi:POT family proton-dependent oligopeptide transporter